jgi:hypothetical protein
LSAKYKFGVKWLLLVSAILVAVPRVFLLPLYAQDNKEKKKPGEIIMLSKLEKESKEFSLKRDIFSPDPMVPKDPIRNRTVTPPPEIIPEEKPPDKPAVDPKALLENEIRNNLIYQGYVIKNSKSYALVSMSGESYAVSSGDTVLDRIKIIKIERKQIEVEVDSYTFEIQLKEDEENEIQ